MESIKFANFLNLEHIGKVIDIKVPSSIDCNSPGCIKFANKYNIKNLNKLNSNLNSFVIADSDYKELLKIPHVISLNPRLDFCRVTEEFFSETFENKIEKTAVVSPKSKIGQNVYIGHNVVVGENVTIGDGCRILHNNIIMADVKIGRDCLIKSGTIIGQKGFGFERDTKGIPVTFNHYGGVIIGNNIEIGAINTICRGVLSDTIINDYVKTDDHVHIAHGVEIETGVLVTAGSTICGSVKIGKNVWVGPNSSIIDNIQIGEETIIGIGSVIGKSVDSHSIVLGNPARKIRKY
jgi:UDP-3-O-[3-hydroxymyristoyl] glucosamine N-acyltransferase